MVVLDDFSNSSFESLVKPRGNNIALTLLQRYCPCSYKHGRARTSNGVRRGSKVFIRSLNSFVVLGGIER